MRRAAQVRRAVKSVGAHQHGMVQRLVQRLACMVVGVAVALRVGLRLKHGVVHLHSCQGGIIRSMLNAAVRVSRRQRRGGTGGRRTRVGGGVCAQATSDEMCEQPLILITSDSQVMQLPKPELCRSLS